MDNREKQALFERYLDGCLTEDERKALSALRDGDQDFDAQVRSDRAIESDIANATPQTFQPFFDAKVMARVRELERDASADLASMLIRFFPRVALPAAVATALLMGQNYLTSVKETPVVEALFGVPSVSRDLNLFVLEE